MNGVQAGRLDSGMWEMTRMQPIAALLIALNLLPNPSFEEGGEAPEGWVPASEQCAWVEEAHTGARALAVTGDGSDSTYWRTGDVDLDLDPAGLYEFSAWMKRSEGASGGAITGPSFANRDVRPGDEWSRTAHVFRVPEAAPGGYVRVGHWRAQGTLLFDDVAIVPVTAVPVRRESITLGVGESVSDGRYVHQGPPGGYAGNYSRCLARHTAHLNTNRWVFFPGAEVVYRHDLGGIAMASATVEVHVGWHAGGECVVEVSRDDQAWMELGTIGAVATQSWEVPEALLPAETIFLRMRSPGAGERGEDSAPGSFQVHSFRFEAEPAEAIEPLVGETTFLIEELRDERLAVEVGAIGSPSSAGMTLVQLSVRNPREEALTATVSLRVSGQDMSSETASTPTLQANEEAPITLAFVPTEPGEYDAAIVAADETGEELYRARFSLTVSELHRANFGYTISRDGMTDLWWCEGTYKVGRTRVAPPPTAPVVRLEAARGEYEPVQVVLRPKQPLTGLTASISDLAGEGTSIPASAVDILRVGYVYVHTPTDAQGAVGWWPDPLPPLDGPIDLVADQNQPLWLRVHVPRDARPGDYRGTLSLEADGWSAEVPIQLRVWDFEMPAERSIVATMGLSSGPIRQYHHLQTDEQMETVWDAYLRSFREHRIDPYHPWLAGPRVNLAGVSWNGGDIVRDEAAPEGEHVLRVVDEQPESNPAAVTAAPMPIDRTRTHVLSFMARAAEEHVFQTTLGCHDADGRWMSGCNIDTRHSGTGRWERYTVEVPPERIAEGCRAFALSLRPTSWVESGEPTGEAWFDDITLTAEGSDENLVADGGFEGGPEGARIEVDFTDWDAWLERYVDGLGFQSFRLPISYMPRRDAPGSVGPYAQGSAAYDRIVGEYLHTLQEHLREKGWLDVAYAYWVDEPAPEHYENVRYGMRLLDEYAPDIRRMLTEQPEPGLVGFVDIWCPVLHNYVEEIARERQAAGEEIWWYVCTGPKAPWAGLFTDHNAIDLRIWQWMGWKYDVSGCLIWATNYWYSGERRRESGEYQNPWEDPMSYRSSGGGWWGNGDGRFVYPPNVDPNSEHEPIVTGPIDSIRWEMLREGLEDREYFELLARRDAGGQYRDLLTIGPEIVESTREFTRDPLPLYARRTAMAEAIEMLGE